MIVSFGVCVCVSVIRHSGENTIHQFNTQDLHELNANIGKTLYGEREREKGAQLKIALKII